MSEAPIVYIYNKITGEYQGSEHALQSPADSPGVWLYPARSTLLEPPAANDTHVPCFVAGEWVLTVNHRGEIMYAANGDHHLIMGPGPIPEGWSLTPPEPEPEEVPAVPPYVPMWKAKIVLDANSLLEAADALIEGSGNTSYRLAWEYATEISRESPLLLWAAEQLELTSEQVDAMFIAAYAIQV